MRALHLLLALSVALGNAPPIFAGQAAASLDESKASAIESTNKVTRKSGVTVDNDGKITTTGGSGSIEDSAKVFNNLTGFQGVTDLKGPATGGVAGASAQVAGSVDLSCKIHRGQSRTFAGGVVVKLTGCQGASALDLEICTNLLQGRTCQLRDFRPVHVVSGAWSALGNLQVGAACNAESVCRVSIVNKGYSIQANGQGLKEAAEQQAATQRADEGSFAGAIAKTATSEKFQKAYNASKDLMTECIDGLQRNIENGQVVTCTGKAVTGDLAATLNGSRTPSCSTIKECLKPGTKTLEFTRTCTRTFPTTNYSCEYKIPTVTCQVTAPAVPGGPPTVNCPDAASLQAKADFQYPSATAPGAGLVPGSPVGGLTGGASDGQAAKSAAYADLLKTAILLTKEGETETYAVPQKAEQVGECSAGPTSLAGPAGPQTCATPLSDQIMECKGDTVGEFCTNPVYSQTCRGNLDTANGETADSCSGAGVQGCELVSEHADSVEGGIVTSATQTYRCTKTEATCLEWKREESCQGDLTLGTSKSTYTETGSNKEAFNKAMVATAVMNAFEESMSAGQAVRVFGGEDRRCKRPRGITSFAANDCCKISLERAGGSRVSNKCSEDDVKLAAARRAQYAYYVGEYCSKRKLGSCTERTQSYCAYPGLLPRIVNEQGRAQLAQAVASATGATLATQQLAYPYYHAQGGGWTAAFEANGIRFAAWQQPAHCKTIDEGKESLVGDPLECPGKLTTVVAACERGAACSELPAHPDFGSDTWIFTYIDPLSASVQALSRGSVAKGACDPQAGTCSYEVRAWPAATGGRAVASNDIHLPLFGDPQGDYGMGNLGDVFFRRRPQAAASQAPAAIQAEVSLDAGRTWTALSIQTTPGVTTRVPRTDIELIGQCIAEANSCTFRAVGTIEATAKPWGAPQNPDCTGFTPGQITAIDFGKMDLSEWIASVLAKVGAADTRGLSETAKEQARQYYEAFATGGEVRQKASPPTAEHFATVFPREQLGPFTVTVRVGGNFPQTYEDPAQNTNPVSRVSVDWNDGTPAQDLAVVSPERGFGFEGNHTYLAPNKLPPGFAAEKTIEHKVKLTVVAKDGPHVLQVSVRNLWKDYTGDADLGRLPNAR